MKEIIFLVEEDPDGGYFARALGTHIFTQADTWEALRPRIKEAVQCHFDDNHPESIYLYHFRENLTLDQLVSSTATPNLQTSVLSSNTTKPTLDPCPHCNCETKSLSKHLTKCAVLVKEGKSVTQVRPQTDTETQMKGKPLSQSKTQKPEPQWLLSEKCPYCSFSVKSLDDHLSNCAVFTEKTNFEQQPLVEQASVGMTKPHDFPSEQQLIEQVEAVEATSSGTLICPHCSCQLKYLDKHLSKCPALKKWEKKDSYVANESKSESFVVNERKDESSVVNKKKKTKCPHCSIWLKHLEKHLSKCPALKKSKLKKSKVKSPKTKKTILDGYILKEKRSELRVLAKMRRLSNFRF